MMPFRTTVRLAREPESLRRRPRRSVLLSQTALARLRSAFGPTGLPFFEFYKELADAAAAKTFEDPFANPLPEEFNNRVRMLARTKLSPVVQNQLIAVAESLRPQLRALQRNPQDRVALRRAAKQLGVLMPLVARDKGVYLQGRPAEDMWVAFRMMRRKEVELERIREEDPQLYEAITKYKTALKDRVETIELRLLEEQLPYKRRFTDRGPVFISTDPKSGDRFVYDAIQMAPVPYDEYVAERKRQARAQRMQTRVFPPEDILEELRTFDEEKIAALPGTVGFVSLTDDKAKTSALTRIYPVKSDPTGRKIIVRGRFKGIPLDSMVNAAGRMIEGTAYNYNPRTNRYDRIETRGVKKGTLNVRAEREPYVTLTERSERLPGERKPRIVQKLFVKIPGTHAFTEARQAMAKLAQVVDSVEGVPLTRKSAYYFDAKDFNIVRETLQSFSLSEKVSKFIREYFEGLAHAEMAAAKENLGYYTMEAIGGFKQTVRGKGLLVKQKQALAWLEARGNNGVCALDTGLGKSLASIAMMQKLKRDGIAEEGNGRFLYVCPKALRGNIKKETSKFLTREARKELLAQLDILTYPQFRNAWKRDPDFADQYVAIFFDEAQELRSGRTQTSKAALKIRHPRKILLTASPIEKEPMDAYVLSAIANNVDVSPGTEARRDMLRFQRRFTETVGGRTIGVKQDPLTKLDLQTYMKQNVFYVDKQDVEELELPSLTQETFALAMDPEVEGVYRSTIADVKNVLRGMVARFRDRGIDPTTGKRTPEARDRRIAMMFSAKLAPLIRKLNDIANFPERFVPQVAARNPDGSPALRADGTPVMTRTGNPKLSQALRLVEDAWENKARPILFTDDARFVLAAAKSLSRNMPGTYHLAAGSKSIHIFRDGTEMRSFLGFDMPFREKKYKRYMDLPKDDATNRNYERAFWQSFVFNEIATPAENGIVSATLHGQIYQTGQNLQAFSTVIHLDRDTWNSEDMKQRTARAWRQGQPNPVKEFTLDVTYDRPSDAFDRTLDEIRGYLQQMDEDLFKQIIKDSQGIALGKEFFDMPRMQARFFDVSRKALELTLAPYVDNA